MILQASDGGQGGKVSTSFILLYLRSDVSISHMRLLNIRQCTNVCCSNQEVFSVSWTTSKGSWACIIVLVLNIEGHKKYMFFRE